MLELRPNCECCDRDLPPDSELARICTYECTFCADCAEDRLGGRCPNCGGDFTRRPIRPPAMLEKHPASTVRITKSHEACASTHERERRASPQSVDASQVPSRSTR